MTVLALPKASSRGFTCN